MVLHEATQSVISTIETLFKNNNTLVGLLILLFSVIVPVLKAIILLAVLLMKNYSLKNKLYKFVAAIGKWSMADVFVIAIFLAYLAAKGIKEDTGLVSFDASLGNGFYFFLGYCLLSVLATQVLYFKGPADNKKKGRTSKAKTTKTGTGRKATR